MNFKMNNRLDVKDKFGKWLEAQVIFVGIKSIEVRFRGYLPKYNEEIDLHTEQNRIREVGAYSQAHGWAKYSS